MNFRIDLEKDVVGGYLRLSRQGTKKVVKYVLSDKDLRTLGKVKEGIDWLLNFCFKEGTKI